MGAGIQQQPVEKSSIGSAFADVLRVLYEPVAVFERVRARPTFLVPFAVVIAVQCILFFVNMPYLKVAIQAQVAAQGRPTPGTPLLVIFGLLGLVIILGAIFVLSGVILWMLASVLGGVESKLSTMLSVVAYAAVPSAILLTIVGTIVLHMQGAGGLTSPQDMQPALGLDLLAPGTKGFMGAVLKSINPFGLWGVGLTAIGVSTTQRMSKGTGLTVAVIGFVIGVLIAGGLGAIFNK